MVASGTRVTVNKFASEDLLSQWLLVTLEAPKEKKSKGAMEEFMLFLYIFVASGTRDTISKNTKWASEDLISYGRH